MKRLFALTALSVAVALALASPAMAYPHGNPTANVSPTSGPPGTRITVSGTNWRPGTRVQITIPPRPRPVIYASVGSNGTFSVSGTIPRGTPAGTYYIRVRGYSLKGKLTTVYLTFRVTDGHTAPLASSLTASSSPPGPALSLGMLMLIAALVVAGLGALASGRRRRGVRFETGRGRQ